MFTHYAGATAVGLYTVADTAWAWVACTWALPAGQLLSVGDGVQAVTRQRTTRAWRPGARSWCAVLPCCAPPRSPHTRMGTALQCEGCMHCKQNLDVDGPPCRRSQLSGALWAPLHSASPIPNACMVACTSTHRIAHVHVRHFAVVQPPCGFELVPLRFERFARTRQAHFYKEVSEEVINDLWLLHYLPRQHLRGPWPCCGWLLLWVGGTATASARSARGEAGGTHGGGTYAQQGAECAHISMCVAKPTRNPPLL